ncbi:MAG: pyrimidine 5'-nucleotidase, partial [Candidatus Fischerbacteria bacterium RBG_13_37_8]
MIEEQAKKTIHFIFDLDNTLYSADIGFFKLIDRNINLYMRDKLHIDEKEIESKRINYFRRYGTTLKGLQLFYEIDPDDYLEYVHDVDLESYLMPDGNLKAMLNELNFPKIVCSNGNFEYVVRVLKILGIHECFEDIIDIRRLEYIPKPYLEAYEIMLDIMQASASQCVFIDDMRRNIRAAAKLGFRT